MQNEMRDRLVNLINQDNCPSPFMCSDKCKYAHLKNCSGDRLADHLIENGVIVLPCKVGTELFLSDYLNVHHRLKEYKFCGDRIVMIIECWEWQRTCTRFLEEFGKTVFLTKEEAEQKLKGGADNG